jgi:hypothetical protein
MSSMSTWAARYVRVRDRAADVSRLRAIAEKDGAELRDDGEALFVVWLVRSPLFEPDDLTEVSREFGEAIGLAVQTIADLVIYDHFVDGQRLRGLTYAGEAGWIRVAGEPESWEAPALFSVTKLEELSLDLEEEMRDDELAREKAELERMWKIGRLQEGSVRPPTQAAALTRAIERAFKLPQRPQ